MYLKSTQIISNDRLKFVNAVIFPIPFYMHQVR